MMSRNEPRCATVFPYDIFCCVFAMLNEIDEAGEYSILTTQFLFPETKILKNWKDPERMNTTPVYIVLVRASSTHFHGDGDDT